jgi:hypothetical protein
MTSICNILSGVGGVRYGYLDSVQNDRLEKMRVLRSLFRGEHRRVFLDERRTQFNFPQMKVNGEIKTPYITLNILKLVTTTLTDLLLGEEAMLKSDEPAIQEMIDQLRDRSDLHRVFYDAAKNASWSGEAMVEVVRWDGEVYLRDVPSDEIFPVGQRQPDGQFASYKRYATSTVNMEVNEGGSRKMMPRTLLLETTYLPGEILRKCFELSGPAGTIVRDVDLGQWPVKQPDGKPLEPKQATGIDWNTIIWMANELDEGRPTSDYEGIVDGQDELNAKQTQIARVIAKHSDPKLAAPQPSADGGGNLSADHDVFYFRTKEEIPAYITWNAELASAIEDRDFSLNAICIASELSQGLLGIERGATPDSARKLRLQATKSLARMKRKATFVKPFIRTALTTALMFENAGKILRVSMANVGVDLRDGLPIDELDQAQTLSLLTGGKPVMSIERAVEQQLADPADQEREVERLNAAAASATPSVFFGSDANADAATSQQVNNGGAA